MRWPLICLCLLGGCSAVAQPYPPVATMAPCQAPVLPPRAPKQPATKQQIAAWSIQLQLAREETSRRLEDCSARHGLQTDWIVTHFGDVAVSDTAAAASPSRSR